VPSFSSFDEIKNLSKTCPHSLHFIILIGIAHLSSLLFHFDSDFGERIHVTIKEEIRKGKGLCVIFLCPSVREYFSRRITMNKKHVEGKKKGDVLIYALSTCGWCSKVKQYLTRMGVAYDYIDVDELRGSEKEEVMSEVKQFNPQCSFPTIRINDTCIVGFKEDKIKEALGE
jgi:glutaredoxin